MTKQTHRFAAEVSQVLKIVINSLYSNKEVFLRELISNASDALDKRRFKAIQSPELLEDQTELAVRISWDREQKTLSIADGGIGMTEEELTQSLGTVAWSGSKSFMQQLAGADKADIDLIGQFGVGFYSAFLVADRIEVVSRAAGSDKAFRWVSSGEDEYSIEPAERAAAGTTVLLHFKDSELEYLQPFKLRQLIERYSDYVPYPIELLKEDRANQADADKDETPEPEFEQVNRANALWRRSPKEITDQQYQEFYKHLSHDWEPALAYRHFQIEGTQMFSGLVFVPKRAPFDLFEPEQKHGMRLHVKRVFVMDNCEELMPRWLRFVKGVVDSEDLPLNVSREVLQDSKAVRIIKKQIVTQTLDALSDLAKDRPEDYTAFWQTFGAVLKEGLHFEPDSRDRLADLLRYESTRSEGLTSLKDYIARMPEGQEAIYYLTGATRDLVRHSPHLEQLKKRGFEVLLMFDAVDPFAMPNLTEYEGRKLISAMDAELDLDDKEQSDESKEKQKTESQPLLDHAKEVLSEQISEVRLSKRLADSPACLVVPEGGLAPHLERLLRARQEGLPLGKRILELNPQHPLVQSLLKLQTQAPPPAELDDWIKLLYEQALLIEGSPLEDHPGFCRRLTALMTRAASA